MLQERDNNQQTAQAQSQESKVEKLPTFSLYANTSHYYIALPPAPNEEDREEPPKVINFALPKILPKGDFLADHMDIFGGSVSLTYNGITYNDKPWDDTPYEWQFDFNKHYTLKEFVGQGPRRFLEVFCLKDTNENLILASYNKYVYAKHTSLGFQPCKENIQKVLHNELAVMGFKDNTNIAGIYTAYFVKNDGQLWLRTIYPYYSHGDLYDVFRRLEESKTWVSINESLFLFYQMLLAVKALHANSASDTRVMDINICPHNFFVGEFENGDITTVAINLLDVNLTRIIANMGISTLAARNAFLAPEQIQHNGTSKANKKPADIWSLGAVLTWLFLHGRFLVDDYSKDAVWYCPTRLGDIQKELDTHYGYTTAMKVIKKEINKQKAKKMMESYIIETSKQFANSLEVFLTDNESIALQISCCLDLNYANRPLIEKLKINFFTGKESILSQGKAEFCARLLENPCPSFCSLIDFLAALKKPLSEAEVLFIIDEIIEQLNDKDDLLITPHLMEINFPSSRQNSRIIKISGIKQLHDLQDNCEYFAPEQILGFKNTEKGAANVWCVGAIWRALILGRPLSPYYQFKKCTPTGSGLSNIKKSFNEIQTKGIQAYLAEKISRLRFEHKPKNSEEYQIVEKIIAMCIHMDTENRATIKDLERAMMPYMSYVEKGREEFTQRLKSTLKPYKLSAEKINDLPLPIEHYNIKISGYGINFLNCIDTNRLDYTKHQEVNLEQYLQELKNSYDAKRQELTEAFSQEEESKFIAKLEDLDRQYPKDIVHFTKLFGLLDSLKSSRGNFAVFISSEDTRGKLVKTIFLPKNVEEQKRLIDVETRGFTAFHRQNGVVYENAFLEYFRQTQDVEPQLVLKVVMECPDAIPLAAFQEEIRNRASFRHKNTEDLIINVANSVLYCLKVYHDKLVRGASDLITNDSSKPGKLRELSYRFGSDLTPDNIWVFKDTSAKPKYGVVKIVHTAFLTPQELTTRDNYDANGDNTELSKDLWCLGGSIMNFCEKTDLYASLEYDEAAIKQIHAFINNNQYPKYIRNIVSKLMLPDCVQGRRFTANELLEDPDFSTKMNFDYLSRPQATSQAQTAFFAQASRVVAGFFAVNNNAANSNNNKDSRFSQNNNGQ